MTHRHRTSTQVYLIAICALALGLRLWGSGQSFWLDEAAQLIISQNPFAPGQFHGDFQPPFFYIVTWAWQHIARIFFEHPAPEWFLRLPSIGIGVATVYMTGLLASYFSRSHAFQRTITLGSALLLATAPMHIYYSHELRMYGLLTLLVVASWYALFTRRWKWLAFITCVGVFTHYFMFVHVVSQIVYLVIQQFLPKTPHESTAPVRPALIALVGGLLPFSLWIPTLLKQISTSQALLSAWPGWSAVSNTGFLKFPALFVAKMTVGMISPDPRWLYGVSVAAMMGALGYMITRGRHRLLLLWGIPLAIGWIAGLFLPATSPTRMQFVLPSMYVWIAHSYAIASGASVKWIRVLAQASLVVIIAQNCVWSAIYLNEPTYQREHWKHAIAYSDSLIAQGGRVVSEYIGPWAPMQWYTRYPALYIGGSTQPALTRKSVLDALGDVIGENATSEEDRPRTLVVYTYLFELSDPQKTLEGVIVENGYALTSQKDFRGVGIVNSYKLQQ